METLKRKEKMEIQCEYERDVVFSLLSLFSGRYGGAPCSLCCKFKRTSPGCKNGLGVNMTNDMLRDKVELYFFFPVHLYGTLLNDSNK